MDAKLLGFLYFMSLFTKVVLAPGRRAVNTCFRDKNDEIAVVSRAT